MSEKLVENANSLKELHVQLSKNESELEAVDSQK